MLNEGADVKKTDVYGATALHYAAQQEIGLIEELLDSDSDINALDVFERVCSLLLTFMRIT